VVAQAQSTPQDADARSSSGARRRMKDMRAM
jgi:hypothetical protein